jgi:uncharacterized protein YdcH (DUF465 family)
LSCFFSETDPKLVQDKSLEIMFRKHPLIDEFPEFSDKIHRMKVADEHFKKLFDAYDKLDHEIYLVESNAQPASDETANHLRIARLRMKDELYNLLKES